MLRRLHSRKERAILREIALLADLENSDDVQKRLDELSASYPNAHRVYQEIIRLQGIVAQKPEIPPSLGFETRVIARAEAQGKNITHRVSRVSPAIALTAAAAFLVVAVLGVLDPQFFSRFLVEKGHQISKAYTQPLQGTIFPLFSDLSKDEVLNFVVSGVVPIDDQNGTALKIAGTQGDATAIQLQTMDKAPMKKVSRNQLFAEVQPSEGQQREIDSLLDIARRELNSALIVSENNELAIAQNIAQINQTMLVGIAAALEPGQRERFTRFLDECESPFAVEIESAERLNPVEVVRRHAHRTGTRKFVVLHPETASVFGIELSQERLAELQEPPMEVLREKEQVIRALVETHARHMKVRSAPAVAPLPDQRGVVITVEATIPDLRNEFRMVRVVPRVPQIPGTVTLAGKMTKRGLPGAVMAPERGIPLPPLSPQPSFDSVMTMFQQEYLRFFREGEVGLEDSVLLRMKPFTVFEFRRLEMKIDSLLRQQNERRLNEQVERFKKRETENPRDI